MDAFEKVYHGADKDEFGIYLLGSDSTSKLFIDFSPSASGIKGQIVRILHDPDEIEVIADDPDDRRVTDPEKWIVTENHHDPIIDRETFDKVQARFKKTNRKWKRGIIMCLWEE